MTVNVTINTPNGTNTFFVNTGTQTQVSPSSSNGIALLRYIPISSGNTRRAVCFAEIDITDGSIK